VVEFMFGGQNGKLYIYRDAGDHLEEVWQKQFDVPVNTPLLADIDGNGFNGQNRGLTLGFARIIGNPPNHRCKR